MSDTHQFTHNKTFYFSHKMRRQLVWNEFSTSKTAEWWGLLRERTSRGNNGKLTRQLQKVKEEEEKLACSNSWLWKEWKVEKSTLHAFTLVLKSSNSIFVPLCVVEAIYTRHERVREERWKGGKVDRRVVLLLATMDPFKRLKLSFCWISSQPQRRYRNKLCQNVSQAEKLFGKNK